MSSMLDVVMVSMAFILLISTLGLMASQNIGGAGVWLNQLATYIQNNGALIGLMVVCGSVLGYMGSKR